MLPPDNFQEDPNPRSRIAHRRPISDSISCRWPAPATLDGSERTETIERLEATLATMERMARFRGHFYNWYDTSRPPALDPKYVSSVDSGNLAGHLIALAHACREWRRSTMDQKTRRDGIADALDLTREHAGAPARRSPNTDRDAGGNSTMRLPPCQVARERFSALGRFRGQAGRISAVEADTHARHGQGAGQRTRRRDWRGHGVLGAKPA